MRSTAPAIAACSSAWLSDSESFSSAQNNLHRCFQPVSKVDLGAFDLRRQRMALTVLHDVYHTLDKFRPRGLIADLA